MNPTSHVVSTGAGLPAAGVTAGAEASGVAAAFEAAATGLAGAGSGAAGSTCGSTLVLALSVAPSALPSTTMLVAQCLQVMRTFLPRTFSSGTEYFAGHPVHV